ncbi:hypothetical protein D3C76_1204350 [compost metagenome]
MRWSRPDLSQLARAYSSLDGYQRFLADVPKLVAAHSCLLGYGALVFGCEHWIEACAHVFTLAMFQSR